MQLLKDNMSGLSYILMMHFGNDVLYFKKEDQFRVYTEVKNAIYYRLKEGGVRLTPYARLIIEPLFAYNHFEDDEEGIQLDYVSSEEDEDYDDDEKPKKSDKKADKGKKGKTSIKITDVKFDFPLGNTGEASEILKQELENAIKKIKDTQIEILHKGKKKAAKKPEPSDSSSGEDAGSDDEPDFLEQMKAFLGVTPEEQAAYLKKTLLEGTEDVMAIQDSSKQIEILVVIVLLSETMVNKSSEDEPAFKFFTSHYAQIRNLMQRFFAALKSIHGCSVQASQTQLDHSFFLVEALECLIYMVLDFSINETASALDLQFSFPIPKSEAKLTLILGNELLQFFLQIRDFKKSSSAQLSSQERHLMEKLFPACCKLVAYMGGYLQQDHGSPDGTAELKTGLQLMLASFCGVTLESKRIVSTTKGVVSYQYIYDAKTVLNLSDDQKYLIYGIFDGLNYLFGLADFKAIEVIVNQDLFFGLAALCQLDKYESEIFERSETSNEFYHL